VLQGVSHKFRSGVMMLMHREGETLSFLGSAFLVHEEGYLLTASHIVTAAEGLVVVPSYYGADFAPTTFDHVAAMPVSLVSRDADRDVALLSIDQELAIGVPDDFLGSSEGVRPGASVMSLGYSFGHQRLHAILGFNAVVAAKVRAHNGTALILFDTMVHDGDRGGPLVHVADGHIVGIVVGRFAPADVVQASGELARHAPKDTNVSYAVAIEYGLDLMDQAGLVRPGAPGG
jgi:serine protease Do